MRPCGQLQSGVVGVRPLGTCSIPSHRRRIVGPGDSAGNYAAGNIQSESVDPNEEERMLLAAFFVS